MKKKYRAYYVFCLIIQSGCTGPGKRGAAVSATDPVSGDIRIDVKWKGILTRRHGGISDDYYYEIDISFTSGDSFTGHSKIEVYNMHGIFSLKCHYRDGICYFGETVLINRQVFTGIQRPLN